MNRNILAFAILNKNRIGGRVLEVGSRNINGTIRDVLPVTVGIDMIDGPGVDHVLSVNDLITTFGVESFDSVVSCDALEHIEDWDAALINMWGVLKPEGVLFLTMAAPRKGRHGYPHDYHRMPLESFAKIFAGNEIVDTFDGGPSLGVCVVKQGDLDMSIRPGKVK